MTSGSSRFATSTSLISLNIRVNAIQNSLPTTVTERHGIRSTILAHAKTNGAEK